MHKSQRFPFLKLKIASDAMETQDLLISCLFAKVKHHQEPEDHPSSVADLAKDCSLSIEQTILVCERLADEDFLVISYLHLPPLVYLTVVGVARAKRLEQQYFAFTHP